MVKKEEPITSHFLVNSVQKSFAASVILTLLHKKIDNAFT